jgi:hypothetical protein
MVILSRVQFLLLFLLCECRPKSCRCFTIVDHFKGQTFGQTLHGQWYWSRLWACALISSCSQSFMSQPLCTFHQLWQSPTSMCTINGTPSTIWNVNFIYKFMFFTIGQPTLLCLHNQFIAIIFGPRVHQTFHWSGRWWMGYLHYSGLYANGNANVWIDPSSSLFECGLHWSLFHEQFACTLQTR